MSETSERLTRLIAMQETARKERDGLKDKRAGLVQASEDEGRSDLTVEEQDEFDALTEQIRSVDEAIIARDEHITRLADEEKRAENAAKAFRNAGIVESQVRVNKEAVTYERGNGRSYFSDLALAELKRDMKAQERLMRHAQESEFEARTNPNRTDGQGGHYEVAAA